MEAALRTFKITYHKSNCITQTAARLVADGNIVGWFQGRMEFGPRALGNRSILADARDPEMKNKVNDSIKDLLSAIRIADLVEPVEAIAPAPVAGGLVTIAV